MRASRRYTDPERILCAAQVIRADGWYRYSGVSVSGRLYYPSAPVAWAQPVTLGADDGTKRLPTGQ